jgi:hypothetical protein
MNRKEKIKYLTLALFMQSLWLYSNHQVMAQRLKQLPKEEVSVHIVNPVSLTEAFLWMDISVKSAGKPSPSKVIYMELLDRNGNSVVAEMAKLEKGQARSYLKIPTELPSDHYLLRVYTRISPYTSGEKGVFQSQVSIINPKKPPLIAPAQKFVDEKSAIPLVEVLDSKKDNLLEVSVPLANAKDISLAINKSSPFDNSEVSLDFLEMYPVDPSSNITLVPEIYGHIVKGKLLNNIDTAETFFLTVHGSQSHMFVDKPDINGNLYFDTGNFSYYEYVVIQSSRTDQQVNFILSSPFWDRIPADNFQLPTLNLSLNDEEFVREMILARASQQYYLGPKEIPKAPLPFQYITDYSYILDDYNRFEDMATTIREYVPSVLVRNQNRKTIFKNFNIPYNQVFKENPLLVIDGMPVFDSDSFANFNPKGIKSMDIVNRYFYINDQRFNGMVSLTSFSNDFGGFDLPKNALFIAYQGIQKPYLFQSQVIGELPDHFPDFRSILAWQTKGSTDENSNLTFSFRPSRLKGKFLLRIHYRDNTNDEEKIALYSLNLE